MKFRFRNFLWIIGFLTLIFGLWSEVSLTYKIFETVFICAVAILLNIYDMEQEE